MSSQQQQYYVVNSEVEALRSEMHENFRKFQHMIDNNHRDIENFMKDMEIRMKSELFPQFESNMLRARQMSEDISNSASGLLRLGDPHRPITWQEFHDKFDDFERKMLSTVRQSLTSAPWGGVISSNNSLNQAFDALNGTTIFSEASTTNPTRSFEGNMLATSQGSVDSGSTVSPHTTLPSTSAMASIQPLMHLGDVIRSPQGYNLWLWEDRIHPIPQNFEFPSLSTKDLWHFWHFGDPTLSIGPFKTIHKSDLTSPHLHTRLVKARRVMNVIESLAVAVGIINSDTIISKLTKDESEKVYNAGFDHLISLLNVQGINTKERRRYNDIHYTTIYKDIIRLDICQDMTDINEPDGS